MTTIYNLIILDESGSMSPVRQTTINGCNETIDTINTAQRKYSESQKHFVSIYAFQSGGDRPSRYLVRNIPGGEAGHIGYADYSPGGCTPLNDAVGSTVVDLMTRIGNTPDTIGSVTIITDGQENSSKEFSTKQVGNLILMLKEKGWNFNFIGASISFVEDAEKLHIDNAISFDNDEDGTREMFQREKRSRMAYYDRVESLRSDEVGSSFTDVMAKASVGYFENSEEQPKKNRPAKKEK